MKNFILKLKQKYANIPSDKRDHFYVSLYMSTVFGVTTTWYLGLGITLSIGLLKELFDNYTKTGTCEINDVKADTCGAVAGSVVPLIMSLV